MYLINSAEFQPLVLDCIVGGSLKFNIHSFTHTNM